MRQFRLLKPCEPRVRLGQAFFQRSRGVFLGWRMMILGWGAGFLPAAAQAPGTGVVHYQGRLLVGAAAFDGTGQFKFALVNGAGSQTFWRNAPDANGDGEPDQAVSGPVARGLYGIDLGDSTLPNMAPIPGSVFADRISGVATNATYLRVWFNDGVSGFQRLTPDQRVTAVSFAMAAASVPDASITAAKLAPGAVTAQSVSGTFLPAQIPNLDAAKLTSGVLDPARLPANVALKTPDLQNATTAVNGQIAALQTQINALKAQLGGGGGGTLPAGLVQASPLPADAALVGAGYARFATLPAASWSNSVAAGGPSARFEHAAVWAGGFNQMFVWGGQVGPGTYSGAGALYRPDTDQWRETSPVDAPPARRGHSMTWNGLNEALIWGGFSEVGFLNTGARYNFTDSGWKPLAAANAPSGRDGHVAALTGPFLTVWGGRNSAGKLGDGAIYHTLSNTWTRLTLAGAPTARSDATAAWTGKRLLIWGGASASGAEASGSQLLFQTAAPFAPTEWRGIASLNAPSARLGHSALWTGSRLLVWGGRNGAAVFGDGASYDPVANTWTALPSADSPSPRAHHVAVWTGNEMVIFGGDTATGATATGAAYDPAANRWRALASLGNPVARTGAAAVWTGTELIVFGGQAGAQPVAALQRLDPQPTWHLYRKF